MVFIFFVIKMVGKNKVILKICLVIMYFFNIYWIILKYYCIKGKNIKFFYF